MAPSLQGWSTRHVLPETDYTNNSTQVIVTFTRKAPMCLDIIPVSCGVSIAAWDASGSQRRSLPNRSLLPTPGLGPSSRQPVEQARWYLFESTLHRFSSKDADG
jgi:hypothetical protein